MFIMNKSTGEAWDSFILWVDPMPLWFQMHIADGHAILRRNPKGELKCALIRPADHSTSRVNVTKGDIILYNKYEGVKICKPDNVDYSWITNKK